MIVASLGRTGAAAEDVPRSEIVRKPARALDAPVPLPEVQLGQLCLTQPTGDPTLVRNPFALAPRNPLPTPVPSPAPIVITPQVPPDIPSSVALSLIGIATTTRADGGAERTAIIVGGPADPLYMVREADAVAARYRVDAILSDGVVLVDGATGASLRLTLR